MKKKKKLTGQQMKFIINMVSLAIFALSYLYIYSGFENKTDDTYQEINIVEENMKSIIDKAAKQDIVSQETDKLNTQIQDYLDSYPADITKVDNLLFVEQMEKELGINFSSVNPSDSIPFYTTDIPMKNPDGTEVEQPAVDSSGNESSTAGITGLPTINNDITDNQIESNVLGEAESILGKSASDSTAQETGTNDNATTMIGLQSTITMNFQTTEEGFIRMIDYINNYPSRSVIDSISVSADGTTNMLTGSMVIKRYALAGSGKEYQEPKIDDIGVGTDDIFGIDSDKPGAPAPADGSVTAGTQQEMP